MSRHTSWAAAAGVPNAWRGWVPLPFPVLPWYLDVRQRRVPEESMFRRRLWTAAVLSCVLVQPTASISAQALDETTRLAALARVWGLVKYFNPRVTEKQIDWDAELLRAIPRVTAATSREELNDELLLLMRRVDVRPRIGATDAVRQPEADRAFQWLDDQRVLDTATRLILKTYRHGQALPAGRYVRPRTGVLGADFSGEAPYASPAYPPEDVRLLAVFRYWNMVQYYFPYRDIMDQRWGDVLPEAIARVRAARDATQYHLALAWTTSRINDAHGVAFSPVLTAYWGGNTAPLRVRYIEGQTVVTKVFTAVTAGADIRPGDVLADVDGVDAAERRAAIAPYVAGSNEGSLHRNVNLFLLRTSRSSIRLGVVRDGVRREVTLETLSLGDAAAEDDATEDKTVWRILPGNIGYLHMGWLQRADVDAVMTQLANTRALIIDSRNYPNSTIYDVAEHLNPDARPFVRFTAPDYTSPGRFPWSGPELTAGPARPSTSYYRGQVILLGDERTQSQAEFTLMAFRTAPDATMIGSPTAGADGNISLITLPGGFGTYFSGIGVFYPDGRPTQRVGIVPDHHVIPTIAGIRAGVDEVLEYALRLVR